MTDFVDAASKSFSMLVVEGEPGIGKTTLWLDAVGRARSAGFRVLSTRPSAAEATVAYTSLVDLVNGVDASALDMIAPPQRLALDRVTLKEQETDVRTSPRAVAAAFHSAITQLSLQGPVLIAVDDLQWLDQSSLFALNFAIRRMKGCVGVLAAVRVEDPREKDSSAWLRDAVPDRTARISLPAFSVDEVRDLVTRTVPGSWTRRSIGRIHEVSAGNPFYALELARVADERDLGMSASLSEVVRLRISGLHDESMRLLLIIAAMGGATVDLLARATESSTDVVAARLAVPESRRIVTVTGNRVSFVHPLLAHGVYGNADPVARRAGHRRLAEVLADQPEARARHLALGSVSGDAATLNTLAAAAEVARARGAPAAAAELLDLAQALGDQDPLHRIQSARSHFDSGDLGRAKAILGDVVERAESGAHRAAAAYLFAWIHGYDDGFAMAAEMLTRHLPEAVSDATLNVRMLVLLVYCRLNVGDRTDALALARRAVEAARRLGDAEIHGQALGMHLMVSFLCGHGVDHLALDQAATLEGDTREVPLAFRPSMHEALLQAWTGGLDVARARLRSIERRCSEAGEDGEWCFVAFHRALVEVWRGNIAEVDAIGIEMAGRAPSLDSGIVLFTALSVRAAHAAYIGDVDVARRFLAEAFDMGLPAGAMEVSQIARATLGFLEVSVGDYDAAMRALQPGLDHLQRNPEYSEIIVASAVPDALEALVALGRTDEAERLVELMQRNGQRLDRAWMLAVALRGRSLVLAARGDVNGAHTVVAEAMTEHDRLQMPFERARTQLLHGQIERRRRQKDSAIASFEHAYEAFDSIGTALWARRVSLELSRMTGVARSGSLTPAEQRVADLAATGMTKRAIAGALFVSPKTVDVHLTSVYRKLGVHSRAELVHHMLQPSRRSDDGAP